MWIAIPAYDEARTIRALAQAALALCPRVIVVDDGSTRRHRAQLQGLPVTLLGHAVNQGKAASLRTAFAHALAQDARCVITLDGDGQHDPADARALLAAWHGHPDRIVIGSRLHDRTQFPPARYRANRFACFWISWAAGHPIADSQSGFRVYPRAVMRDRARAIGVRGSRFTFESEILIEAARQGHTTSGGRHPGRYPDERAPQPLPAGGRHREDRRDGRRPPAAQGHGAAAAVAQPSSRRPCCRAVDDMREPPASAADPTWRVRTPDGSDVRSHRRHE